MTSSLSLSTFVAPVTLAVTIRNVLAHSRPGNQFPCDDADLTIDAPAVQMFRQYQQLAPVLGKLVPISANDDPGKFAREMLRSEFPTALPLVVTGRTPLHITTPHPDGPSRDFLTYHSKEIRDIPEIVSQLQPFLPRPDGWLVLGVSSACEADLSLQLLNQHSGPAYVTLAWCDDWSEEDQSMARKILRHQTSIKQLTRQQLQRLTGESDVTTGLCVLREQGIENVIVTSETGALLGYCHGRWHYTKSYGRLSQVDTPERAIPAIAGTLLAALERGETFNSSLELAAANLASEANGHPCQTWGELLAFQAEHQAVFIPETTIKVGEDAHFPSRAFRIAAATATAGVMLISSWLAISPWLTIS